MHHPLIHVFDDQNTMHNHLAHMQTYIIELKMKLRVLIELNKKYKTYIIY